MFNTRTSAILTGLVLLIGLMSAPFSTVSKAVSTPQPIQLTKSFSPGVSSGAHVLLFSVPNGKRLVIETLTVRAALAAGEEPDVSELLTNTSSSGAGTLLVIHEMLVVRRGRIRSAPTASRTHSCSSSSAEAGTAATQRSSCRFQAPWSTRSHPILRADRRPSADSKITAVTRQSDRRRRALRPELTQVMVDVQISPPEPFRLRELAEDRMRRPMGVRVCAEPADESFELADVRREISRAAACSGHLIDLGPAADTARPG